ncbi:TRAP transporter substrate-binding protein [Pseudomonas sp. GD03721]|nr:MULTISPECIES: TRAP transporter substrate-binding protein [unclassified Pseudomonas]MDH1443254.1 TRAP transporter substrate-binding protein [Pseudomonas sp. GD03722]WGG00696.1 TRAP transporter substrate-binding protein [Pseudomonas sp. GD03721]WGG04862.1 TRAP transporter substrate-binding protein [Pseudomonas sp. GD03919]
MKPMLTSLSVALLACYAGSSLADTVTLKISHFLPSNSNVQQNVIQPWCDDLKQASSGRLVCQIYPSMQLGGTPAKLADQARQGVADVVWMAPGYTPGRFPKTEALELPGVLPQGGLAAGRVIWSFYQQHLSDEYAPFKVLAMHSDGGMNLHTTKHQLRTSADLQGLRLRVPNRTISRTLETLGAVPVAMPPAMVTEALSKGVVDGASAVWEVLAPTKMDEITHHHLDSPADQPVLGATVLGLLMNKRKYDSLPADLREIVDQHSGLALVERFGKAWDEAGEASRQKVIAAGHEVNRMSEDDYRQVLERLRPVEQQWVADIAKKDVDGQALIDAARALTSQSPR